MGMVVFKRRTSTINYLTGERVPRIMMVLYGIVFYNTMQWFMALENPNNAQGSVLCQ